MEKKVGIVVVSKYFKDLKRIDQLNEIEHWVTQQSGTERPGTGKYLKNKNLGIYEILFQGSHYFLLMINMSLAVVGPVLQSL